MGLILWATGVLQWAPQNLFKTVRTFELGRILAAFTMQKQIRFTKKPR